MHRSCNISIDAEIWEYGMSDCLHQAMGARVKYVIYAAVVSIPAAAISAVAAAADGQLVMPPQSAVRLLEVVANGVQIYACEAKESGFEWVFKAPDARLFDKQGRQVGTHFAGPTWKMDDGSTVVGEVVAAANAPEPDAIPWLLLRAKSHEGSGALSDAAYIRRADTKGGSKPRTGCDAAHHSEQTRAPYSATYQFFKAATSQ
jgi:hypothetical protein